MVPSPILIVGAGPTGLTAALELARRGIPIRIIDKIKTRSDKSRALVIHARSTELLDKCGLGNALAKAGQIAMGISVFVMGRRMAAITLQDVGVDDSPFPYVITLSQQKTEEILEERLNELGVNVEFQTELIELHQGPDDVRVKFRGPGGIEQAGFSYVIGADGAHSMVRHELGLEFPGAPYPQDFLLADVAIDWDLPSDRLLLFLGRIGIMAVFPLEGRALSRIIVARQLGDNAPHEDEVPLLEEVESLAKTYSGRSVHLSNPKWLSRFRLHHRGVRQYRKGRVFIMGDAAHIHSPAGGQGMNTGIQDAFNLAWKLALVWEKRADDSFLDSYQDERHPVGDRLLKTTDRFFEFMATDKLWLATLRNLGLPVLLPLMARYKRVRRRVFRFVSQIGIRYRHSKASREDIAGTDDKFEDTLGPGWRVPAASLWDHSNVELNLYDLLKTPDLVLLLFSKSQDLVRRQALLEVGDRCKAAISIPLQVFLIVEEDAPSDQPTILQDRIGECFERFGVTNEACYLVRPDGYIGYRANEIDEIKIKTYCAEVFNGIRASDSLQRVY